MWYWWLAMWCRVLAMWRVGREEAWLRLVTIVAVIAVTLMTLV
jgi:hypothetical protein